MKILAPRILLCTTACLLYFAFIASILPEDISIRRWFAAFFAANAFLGMCFSFILSIRVNLLENIFGGLDKVYKLHKYIGMWYVFSIFMHWGLMPDGINNSPLAEFGSDIGEWGTWLLLVLVSLSFLKFMPYEWWKITHKLMGLVFLVSIIHYVFSVKPFNLFSATGIVLNLISIIGLVAIYYHFKNINNNKKFLGKVHNLKIENDYIDFEVKSANPFPKWQAGQFAFLSVVSSTSIKKEEHPFTIANSSNSDNPRFCIRALGDFTNSLKQNLKEGDLIQLNMPYGKFELRENNKNQIWLATGIGITPFLAWLEELKNSNKSISATLYYLVKDEESNEFVNQLKELCSQTKNIELKIYSSNKQRLIPMQVYLDFDKSLTNSEIYFCGNEKVRKEFKNKLEKLGLPKNSCYYEYFDFR